MAASADPLTLAQSGLLWLAAEPERIGGFLGASGLAASEVRTRAADPAFLGFVLDYILAEDAWVLSFAEETGHRPEDVATARAALPGGDVQHWT